MRNKVRLLLKYRCITASGRYWIKNLHKMKIIFGMYKYLVEKLGREDSSVKPLGKICDL